MGKGKMPVKIEQSQGLNKIEPASGLRFCKTKENECDQASLFLRKAFHLISNCPCHLGIDISISDM